MPAPGTRSMARIMSAISPRPEATTASIACSLVVPAGRRELMAPSKTILVARPRTLGAATARTTEATEAAPATASWILKGARRAIIRVKEGQKALARPGGGPALQSPEEAWALAASASSSSSAPSTAAGAVGSAALIRRPRFRAGR